MMILNGKCKTPRDKAVIQAVGGKERGQIA